MNCRTCMQEITFGPAADGTMRVAVVHVDPDVDDHDAVADDPGIDQVQALADQLATVQLALSIGGTPSMLLPILLPLQSAFHKVVQFAQMSGDNGMVPGLQGKVDARLVSLLASANTAVPDDLSGLDP